ncbi:MAG: hypothetical protein ACYSU0_15985, partial [Planctomycetota bacterium]
MATQREDRGSNVRAGRIDILRRGTPGGLGRRCLVIALLPPLANLACLGCTNSEALIVRAPFGILAFVDGETRCFPVAGGVYMIADAESTATGG